jgi:hypothetical protein
MSASWYSASPSPAFLTFSKNFSFHLLAGIEPSRADEIMNTVPSPPELIEEILASSLAKCLFCKTVEIGWFSPPPFSGRYSGRLDNASGFPF